jgi:prepilin signal peptidase PulO-like enzyme (type II secretory pathway)
MTVYFLIIFFALGAIVASFMGLVAARLYTGAPITHGRSKCDACNAPLSPLALIPVFSLVFTGGRCLVCKARVGYLSTLAELVLGTLFVLAYLTFGITLTLLTFLIALTLLAGLVLYDAMHQILPPVLLWPFVGASAIFLYLNSCGFSFTTAYCLLPTFFLALLLGSLIALIHLVSGGRAMGLADAPLTFGLALIVGYPLALSGLIFSFWVGGVVGIWLLAKRVVGVTIQSEVPFAPFLAVGFLLALFTQWDAFTFTNALFAPLGI